MNLLWKMSLESVPQRFAVNFRANSSCALDPLTRVNMFAHSNFLYLQVFKERCWKAYKPPDA